MPIDVYNHMDRKRIAYIAKIMGGDYIHTLRTVLKTVNGITRECQIWVNKKNLKEYVVVDAQRPEKIFGNDFLFIPL